MSPTPGTPIPYVNRQRADSTTRSAYYNNSNARRFPRSSAELLTRDVEANNQDYQQQQQRVVTPGPAGAGYNPSFFQVVKLSLKVLMMIAPPSTRKISTRTRKDGTSIPTLTMLDRDIVWLSLRPMPADTNGYQQLPTCAPKTVSPGDSTTSPVELVTVLALGAEWGKDELRAMTNFGKR